MSFFLCVEKGIKGGDVAEIKLWGKPSHLGSRCEVNSTARDFKHPTFDLVGGKTIILDYPQFVFPGRRD